MRRIICLLLIAVTSRSYAQELYVFTEPASNMPAHSVSTKFTGHFTGFNQRYGRFSQRYMPEIMFGFSKKLMVHLSATFADMHTTNFTYESAAIYMKYRFLSNDEMHKHFRMAVFADASRTSAPFHYDEVSLMEMGLIATQLWHKLAISGTVSHTQVLDMSRNNKVIYVPERNYQSMNYALSAGYLLFPTEYTDYKQTNLNIYTEFLAQQALDRNRYFVDMAPAVQLIFNSNTKLNLGYRFQLNGNMSRMTSNSWLLSVERTFLGALKKTNN
jgi:hypothetical protein